MTLNLLVHPTALLKHSLQCSIPWSQLVTSLLQLLKLYSSGLSLSVAADHLAAFGKSVSASTVDLHRAQLVRIAESPKVWHLSLSDGRQVALFEHSSFSIPIPAGVTLTFSSTLTDPAHHTAPQVDALRIAISAFNRTEGGPHDSKNVISAQHAETLSQSTFLLPTLVCFPTTAVLIDLHTFPKKKLPLPLPIDKYTLQRVWDERTLSPLAIFAYVTDVDVEQCTMRLQDSPSLHTSQPSVQCSFSDHHAPFITQFRPECKLLLLNSVVQPTGDSFGIVTTQSTLCMILQPDSNHQSFDSASAEMQPPLKRVRADADLSRSASPVSTFSLDMLQHPRQQLPLVVHGRLSGRPFYIQENNQDVLFPCGSTTFRLQKKFSERLDYFVEADEVLFTGVRWDDEDIKCKGWVADEVDNLSTMTSILFAPFMRNLVGGKEVQRRIETRAPCSTAHVHVHVRNIRILQTSREIRLSVADAGPSDHEVVCWPVAVTNRGLKELFMFADGQHAFWRNDVSRIVEHCMNRLMEETWIMTLSCNGARWPAAQLCACVIAADSGRNV